MNDRAWQEVADEIHELAKEIRATVSQLGDKVGPWKPWYAWHPVTTVGNERVWNQRIYRRTRYTILKRYAGYEYATDFDLLKDSE